MQLKFTALLVAFVASFGATAVNGLNTTGPSTFSTASIASAMSLTAANHYGAPTAPWQPHAKPGWYLGSHSAPEGILCVLEGLFCELLELFTDCLQCPKSPPPKSVSGSGYTEVFCDLSCASQDDSYLTYGLVDTIEECECMCDSVSGCVFFNTYHDNNADGKGDSTELTCALFSKRLDESSAINCGDQPQANGGVDCITDSEGYSKK
uniref:Apple domain-containing protein n=1 Tax=Mycena chlorophos TaxID=658473 RepID=A0ABQ0M159_MYCCL|nr:predicted protein [Mycena chlorophos]